MTNQDLLETKNYMSSLKKLSPDIFRKRNILGQFLLHKIVSQCDVESAKYCIKQFPQALIEEDFNGNLPIHIAVINNNDDVARLMIAFNPILGIELDGHGRTITELRDGRSDSLWLPKVCCCNIL
jgi:ankyrin repeat protein